MTRARIVLTDHGHGAVYLDENEVPGVCEIVFRAAPGEANQLQLVVYVDQIMIEAEVADVTTINDGSRRYVSKGVAKHFAAWVRQRFTLKPQPPKAPE